MPKMMRLRYVYLRFPTSYSCDSTVVQIDHKTSDRIDNGVDRINNISTS